MREHNKNRYQDEEIYVLKEFTSRKHRYYLARFEDCLPND